MIRELLGRAESGGNVYVSELHSSFGSLAEKECDRLACVVDLLDGSGQRRFDLRFPRLDPLGSEELLFVESYVQAEVYNILSALGGRRLEVYLDPGRSALAAMAGRLPAAFGVGRKRSERSGYGRAVNVIDRMLGAMRGSARGSAPAFGIEFGDIAKAPEPAGPVRPRADVLSFFKARTEGLGGKALVGIDVGGTDIKAVLVDDGRVVAYKEYDWFPAGFRRSRELVEPIYLIASLLRARLSVHRLPEGDGRRGRLAEAAARALDRRAGDGEMRRALAEIESAGLGAAPRLDGIGLCFPDVVVKDKIVGGEVYKTRGIRGNPEIDYESDFAELTDLDLRLGALVRPGGRVRIVNDGPMASFTAAVEMAASPRAGEVAKGVFAHTLGTELGSGWVTETGAIPDIPLEVYNFVIDLGSWPERAYEPDDARSVNNFNTGLPGTLQKYCSQSGVFRLALKYFPSERPDLLRELVDRGFLERRALGGTEGWYVPTEPVDMRKSFLEHMMSLPEREGDGTNARIWREVGEALAVTSIETRRILDPGTDERFLFGRLVKNRACFELMAEGARRLDPGCRLVVAGTGMANSPLMKELERHPELTVAQFAQAIGAVYFANE